MGHIDIFYYKQGKVRASVEIQANPVRITYHEHESCFLASGMSAVQCWKIDRFVPYTEYIGHTGPVIGVYFRAQQNELSQALISGGQDSKICIWNVDRFGMFCGNTIKEPKSEIHCIGYTEEEDLCITGMDNGQAILWDVDTEASIRLKGHDNSVSCVAFAKFVTKTKTKEKIRHYAITGGFDGKIGTIYLSEYLKQNVKPYYENTVLAHACEVVCVIANPLDKTFISGGNDGTIKIWSKDLDLVGTLKGHAHAVTSLALDGYFLFSAGEDNVIHVWETMSKQKIKVLEKHTADVTMLRVVPDTGHIISCSRDGTVYMWDYTQAKIIYVCTYIASLTFLFSNMKNQIQSLQQLPIIRRANSSMLELQRVVFFAFTWYVDKFATNTKS